MILWTIQPHIVYEQIWMTGAYRCDPARSQFLCPQYDWMVHEMKDRIGPPPAGVTYPVWAWHTYNGRRHQPDLRSERWGNGFGGEGYVCMEIEVPDEQVLLSDFDGWSVVLLNWPLAATEGESETLLEKIDALPEKEAAALIHDNWKAIFDLKIRNWCMRGEWIQATFWELRKEQVRRVRQFRTVCSKQDLRAIRS